jgi:hypothetical protein
MKPATLNACLVLAENRDLGLPVLQTIVDEWLMAQQMNFRRLIYRPSLIADDESWPTLPDDPQIAAVLRFVFGMEPAWAGRPGRR